MLPGKVIYQSDRLSARFVEGETERVAVCFPDRVHPVGFDQPGWGEGFLTKRGVSAIYIAEAGIDWFQCPDFFDAMQACRAALGQRPVTTYGSSMGGYAAILGARALGADRCFALSPQYSIDPEVVPFERDPIEWMRSFYLQSVQNRRPGSKTDHPSARNLWQTTRPYQSFFDLPYCQELLDFPAMRERIKTAFGAEKVTALGFQSGKDVVPLFCEAMGWPMPAIGPALTRNPSISDTEAEILRQANELKDGQARLIKALISQPGDFDAGTLRLAKAQKLAKQARGFPWGKLTFRENPPLKIRQEEFDRRVVELRQNAEAILLRVKAQ